MSEDDKVQSVTFYKSFRDAMRKLQLDSKARVYDALIDYGIDGTETDFGDDYLAEALFTAFRPNIDASQRRKAERAEAGRKGGLKRAENFKQNSSKIQANASKGQANSSKDQANASIEEKEKEKVKENEKVNENVKVKENANTQAAEAAIASVPEPERDRYGIRNNVRLNAKEFAALMERFPVDYAKRIDDLSLYLASTGKRYKDHYATILNWARMEEEKQKDRNTRKTTKAAEELDTSYQMISDWASEGRGTA